MVAETPDPNMHDVEVLEESKITSEMLTSLAAQVLHRDWGA